MSSQQQTSKVYIQVIEDVINKVRDEFVISNGGPGETVLNELQALWEVKMLERGTILGPIERSSSVKFTPGGPSASFHDLNVMYEEEYKPPTELLFPHTPMHTPLPGSGQSPLSGTYNMYVGDIPLTSEKYTTNNGGGSGARTGMPKEFVQPPAHWLTQTQIPLLDDAAHHKNLEPNIGDLHQPTTQDLFMISSGKRKREDFPSQFHNGYIPQQDGTGDTVSDELKEGGVQAGEGFTSLSADQKSTQGLSSWIPEVDGLVPDQYNDALYSPTEVVNEDHNIVTPTPNNYQEVVNEGYNIVTPAPIRNGLQDETPTIVIQNDVTYDKDDEDINENDDDDLDDVEKEEETKIHHLILAQFDKVSRIKNRWKCTLKNGIMYKDNNEVLFNKATGEFEF